MKKLVLFLVVAGAYALGVIQGYLIGVEDAPGGG
jgi:hypothetical protein